MKRFLIPLLCLFLAFPAFPAAAQEAPAILIAYFTWAENTVIEDEEASLASALAHYDNMGDSQSGVDATSYPSNYDDCLDRAADELDDNARPALKTHVENMDAYDVVFLGMPNWWYSCPMAVLTFVEEYDFSGKTVIPFVAHGTGGISGTVRDMTASLPEDCNVLSPIGVYRPDIPTCGPTIEQWLTGLGLSFPIGDAPDGTEE